MLGSHRRWCSLPLQLSAEIVCLCLYIEKPDSFFLRSFYSNVYFPEKSSFGALSQMLKNHLKKMLFIIHTGDLYYFLGRGSLHNKFKLLSSGFL